MTAIANTANGFLTRNQYNAFGELSSIPNTANSIGYIGQRLDAETGLMALGNGERYYSPSYARFIQQDSVVGYSPMPADPDTPVSMWRDYPSCWIFLMPI